ncbi:MAG: hypothetical protein J7485_09830 [Sphingobium sp.]|nr:hypothetical protein [Sphingobium sp.]
MTRPIRWLVAIAAPLLLASCILTPGKFTSTLDIRADRSFTFTYLGEVQLAKTKGLPDDEKLGGEEQGWEKDAEKPTLYKSAYLTDLKGRPIAAAKDDFGDTQDEASQMRRLAEALSKEYGFRSVKYIGNRKLLIDYSISGKLDHAFIFPFHPDADVILPFIAIELRGKDKVRVKAPGYANQQNMSASLVGMGGMPAMGAEADASSALDGTFTLTTNGAIVSQNQEDGAQSLPNGSKQIVWKANPQTKEAPLAVLQLNPLP